MSQVLSSAPGSSAAPQPASSDLVPRLLRVAWMGVLLGVAIELLVLLALGMAGKLPPLLTILADTAQKVTWSTLVCAALAAAQTLVRVQALGMAAAGLLGAPIALLLARSVHKAVNAALEAAPAATQAATPWVLAGLKGVEYALLGLLLIRLAKRARGLGAHAAAGAGLGLAFFGVLTWLMPLDGAQPQLMRAINEVLHPMGCALVIYFGAQFGNRLGARTEPLADDN